MPKNSRPVVPGQLADSRPTVGRKKPGRSAIQKHKHGRSRITNGTALLPDVDGLDGRSPWVRRAKDVIAAHIGDLGGADNTSEAERSIIRRASILTTELERLEAKFAIAGGAAATDLDLYQRTAGNLRVGCSRPLACRGGRATRRRRSPRYSRKTKPRGPLRRLRKSLNEAVKGAAMTTEIDHVLTNHRLLGAGLGDIATWRVWLTVLKAAFGRRLDKTERKTFRIVAGDRAPPDRRVRELWCVAGRRSGKSRMAAATTVYLALFQEYRLAPGEKGMVLVLAASVDQARTVFQYIRGFLEAAPALGARGRASEAFRDRA